MPTICMEGKFPLASVENSAPTQMASANLVWDYGRKHKRSHNIICQGPNWVSHPLILVSLFIGSNPALKGSTGSEIWGWGRLGQSTLYYGPVT